MNDNFIKQLVKRLYFRPGTVRRIRIGPLRGMVFKVSGITGLSPWYSGAEREHQRTFRTLVKQSDVVMDIGANWGLHTLYLSRLVGTSGKVVAVEPYPPAFAELEWHVAANHCHNVTALPFAISDRNGEITFLPGDNASTGSVVASSDNSPLDAIPVPSCRLDSIVDKLVLDRLDLIKIDVEGAEGQVLRGAKQVAEEFKPAFVIDLHSPEQDVFVAQWLTERGYLLRRLSGPPIRCIDVGWPEPEGVWGSILALPC